MLSLMLLVVACGRTDTPAAPSGTNNPTPSANTAVNPAADSGDAVTPADEFQNVDDFDDMEQDIAALDEDPGFADLENAKYE